jgi:hypothetical protein
MSIRTEWQAERELDYLNPALAAERDRHEAVIAAFRRQEAAKSAALAVVNARKIALRWCGIHRFPAAHGYQTDPSTMVAIAASRSQNIRQYLRTRAWARDVLIAAERHYREDNV